MTEDLVAQREHLEAGLVQLGRELPGPMGGFARLHRKATADGALRGSVKEMMALAIGVAVGCEGCIIYHTAAAIEAGATREEILEAIGVAVLMAGGPGAIHAVHALDALDQFLPQGS